MKELEALQDAAEAKREGDLASPRTQAVDDNDKKDVVPKNENDGKTAKSEEEGRGGAHEEQQGKETPATGEEETKTDEDGPSVSDAAATPTPSNSEESEAKAKEEKNENEAEEGGEKKAKTTKKKSKKEKKEVDPVLSPRAAAAGNGNDAAGGEKKKKKKKKKAPKTPRGGEGTAATTTAPAPASGGGSGIGAVTPLKLDEGAVGDKEGTKSGKAKKKGAQTERTRITNNDPPLSAVRAGPTTKSLASSSSHSAAAPPSPSAGVKFAQRLSLANVIPKLSTLPFEKKPRVFNSNIYTQSFSGKTLVKWMLEAGTGVRMDLEAMILGELMLNAGAIVPLSRKVEFSASGKDFYALTEGYADYARPRNMSVGGPGGGSMIGGRAGSNDEMRRAARRSSVMLTFRSISMRGLNHLAGFAKEKDKKDDDQEQPTNLVYGKSLEEVMALQMISHPDEKIPIILKTLTKAIIDTQGHKTEGIFRVPGKNDEISRLKAQFNKVDYTITSDDPNDLGGCLKMWFRELKDPLIPNSIYDECVLVANNPAECLEMVDTRVPELNKTVIYFLLGFLQEMSRHAGVTRMGSANLGMVFAPGLLRCEDVMKMMTNTAHEGAFVKNLIEHYRPAEN
ncbi:RhoGAP domain containing protein [Acanthamoeba castellanii str. Neff]|uniref:RhoGAP domain containing protein n=1 Tax=Acanthamoeba castellanii (strain ATCC 30010 / Neff) TaxID=1257118 RepID=L8HJC4_ACACF|nr:RhoGAP domain containing protein [Acanthamoeba castellanii str. Neff]ELR25295.1 RhoGAP domain containing protein [Acanthamoeba castellanii str. Neff]